MATRRYKVQTFQGPGVRGGIWFETLDPADFEVIETEVQGGVQEPERRGELIELDARREKAGAA